MKKNIVFLLILIPIIWISCDGMGHQTIDFRKIENLMPQHPDSALMLLEQIENKENLSRKDKAHYYLLLTEAQDKTFVKHETDSLITIATDYYEETDDLERKAKAWYYRGRISQDQNHPLKAQECYLKALRDEESIKDHALLGRVNNYIGILYTFQDVYEKALSFQKKAVSNFRAINDSIGQAYASRDLGRVYQMLALPDSAIACYLDAIALIRSFDEWSIYSELGNLYIEWIQRNVRGRVYTGAIGLALTIPSLLLLGFGHNFPMIIGGGLCFGIGYGIFDANNMPILCQFISPRYRATAYGIMNMTGVFAGAAITDILGKSTDAGNLGHDFAMLAGLVLIALLIQVIFLRPKVANMTDEC